MAVVFRVVVRYGRENRLGEQVWVEKKVDRKVFFVEEWNAQLWAKDFMNLGFCCAAVDGTGGQEQGNCAKKDDDFDLSSLWCCTTI